MIAVKSLGLDPASPAGIGLATSFGSMVGTLGTVLFYGTATINLAWQHIGWKAVEEGNFHKLYFVDMGLPWISHIICSFIPTVVMCLYGQDAVEAIKNLFTNGRYCNADIIHSRCITSISWGCYLIKTSC